MPDRLLDTHAHLIADDWETYRTRPFTPDLPMPERPPFTVTAEALLALMDEHGVDHACLVQRGHVYGYDNSYDNGYDTPPPPDGYDDDDD